MENLTLYVFFFHRYLRVIRKTIFYIIWKHVTIFIWLYGLAGGEREEKNHYILLIGQTTGGGGGTGGVCSATRGRTNSDTLRVYNKVFLEVYIIYAHRTYMVPYGPKYGIFQRRQRSSRIRNGFIFY